MNLVALAEQQVAGTTYEQVVSTRGVKQVSSLQIFQPLKFLMYALPGCSLSLIGDANYVTCWGSIISVKFL